VTGDALHLADEPDTAGVVLIPRVVKALSGGIEIHLVVGPGVRRPETTEGRCPESAILAIPPTDNNFFGTAFE
jgi:hypothetical protein